MKNPKITNPILTDLAKQSGELGTNLIRQTVEVPVKMAADAANQTAVLGREINPEENVAKHKTSDNKRLAKVSAELESLQTGHTTEFKEYFASVDNSTAPRQEQTKQPQEQQVQERKPLPPLQFSSKTPQGPGKVKKNLAVSNTRLEMKVNKKAA